MPGYCYITDINATIKILFRYFDGVGLFINYFYNITNKLLKYC